MPSVFKRERKFSNSGSEIHLKRELQLMEDGTRALVIVGKENVHDEIESHQEACSITNILERYRHGDTEALTARVGQYFDASALPTDPFEIRRQIENGRYMFDHLPVSVRARFDHNFDVFVASMNDKDFNDRLYGVKNPDPVNPVNVEKVEVSHEQEQ